MEHTGDKKMFIARVLLTSALLSSTLLVAQDSTKPPTNNNQAAPAKSPTRDYSGMYAFLKDGEFVQLTVEDTGQITGFVSRYGDGDSDKGAFLDQYFKSGKLDGNRVSFTTETVHGVWFDFKGSIERGAGKDRGDEAYYVMKGTLTENSTDAEKKVSTRTREVALKSFPQDAAPAPAARN